MTEKPNEKDFMKKRNGGKVINKMGWKPWEKMKLQKNNKYINKSGLTYVAFI